MILKCKKCQSTKIKKNWKRLDKQKVLCKNCWYVWILWKSNNSKNIESDTLFKDYVNDDLKYRQIAPTLNVSKRTIQNKLDNASFKKIIVIQ